jgi:hypothetical protein
VLATALGISFADLARLREHVRAVVILSLLPLPVLVGAAWLLGRPFAPLVRDGLLAVGLSSAEVASVGLVALAGADAAIALGVVTGSLVLAALVGPVAIGWLSGSSVRVGSDPRCVHDRDARLRRRRGACHAGLRHRRERRAWRLRGLDAGGRSDRGGTVGRTQHEPSLTLQLLGRDRQAPQLALLEP